MAVAGPAALAAAAAGQILGGVEQNRAARSAARADDENSRRTILLGEQEALQTSREERRISGDMIAAMASSGFEMGGGTFGDLIAQSAYQRELEVLNIRTTRTQEANNLRAQADERRAAGRAALVQGMFGAVSGALAGASDLRRDAQMRNQVRIERQTTLGGGTQAVPAMRVGG